MSEEAGYPDWPGQSDMGEERQLLLPEGHGVERGWSNPNCSNQMPSHMVSRMKKAEGLCYRTHRLLREMGLQERFIKNIRGWLSSDHGETAQLLEKVE